MAWTQAEIDTLKRAIASGVLTVKHGETLTTYRSLSEMQRILDAMEGEVNETARPRRTVAAFGNGC